MESKLSPLEEALSYQNEELVFRFSEDHHVSIEDSQELFLETKRWLWLCAKRKVDFEAGRAEFLHVPLLSEFNAIDLMWHTFLLFTRDYAEYCERYFGFFVHHYPQTRADKAAFSADQRKAELEKAYGFIYDELGREVLIRWCEEYPARFSGLS